MNFRSVAASLFLSFGPALLAATPAFAAQYALLLGGASGQGEPERHEFARDIAVSGLGLRDRGYQVTSLFGGGSNEQPETPGGQTDSAKYAADYAYLRKQKLIDRPATAANLDAYFESLISKVGPGDKVEIFLSTHGQVQCTGMEGGHEGTPNSGCHHVIGLFDSSGHKIEYPSDRLIGYLARLEAKGALPNLSLSACSSGFLKPELARLHNSCVMLAAGASNLSFTCGEGDPPDAMDYTGIGEAMTMRYYSHMIDRLATDPYFSQSRCFNKVTQRYREHAAEMSFENMESTYWSGRRFDLAPEEPTLSTSLDSAYFQSQHYGLWLEYGSAAVCIPSTLQGIDQLMAQVRGNTHAALRQLRLDLFNGLRRYNTLSAHLTPQIDAYEARCGAHRENADRPPPANCPALEAALDTQQQHARELSHELMGIERDLVDRIHQLAAPAPNPACRRPL